MDEEMDALQRNHTWDEVDRPTDRRVINCKWVFKIKLNADESIERFKGRVVRNGFTQLPGHDLDETFAPVVRYDSLRYLLAIAAHHGWLPQQMDVKSVFLYGVLQEEIYMELREGYGKAGKVARLRKCIYGLKQPAREWYACLSTCLSEKGFGPANFDPASSFAPSRKSSPPCTWTTSSYLDHKRPQASSLLPKRNTSSRTLSNAKTSAPLGTF